MWETLKLGDICDISIGKTPSRGEKRYWDKEKQTENVWLSIADLTSVSGRYISDSKEYVSDEGAKLFKPVPKDTLVMSFKLSIGKLAFTQRELRTNEAIAALLIKDESLVTKEFLYHYLSSLDWGVLAGNDEKVKGKTLNKKKLNVLEVILPPLTEQQRIVAKLDAAFAEIDRAIELEYQKSFSATALESQAMTGWLAQHSSQSAIYKISDAVDNGWIQAPFDGNHGEIHPKAKDYVSYGVPFLMASDIRNGHADLKNCKFLTRELADNLRKGFAKDGDVLLTHKGTVGEAAILSCELDYVMLTPQVTAYRVLDDGRISRDFLYYQFKSEYFQRQIRDIAGIGTTRAYIGITRQKELELYLPPLELQNEIVKLLQTVEPSADQLSRVANKKIAELSYLKSAILAQELQPPQSEAA